MSSDLRRAVKDFVSAIKESESKQTKPFDTQAEVIRIEDDIAWVHIPGGIDETPVKLTIDSKVGDIVQVRVSGGRAWITGNATSPPTDDKTAVKAREAARKAQGVAEDAQAAADEVADIANSANNKAITAISLAEGVNEHFWYDSTGAHITENTQEDYQDDPANAGGNTLITSQGMAIRKGQTPLATFADSGTQIGITNGGHTIITAQGLKVFGGNGYQLANIGYGEGKNEQGEIFVAPYFSLGDRANNSVVGNFSVAEGSDNTASGFCTHAEGERTIASGSRSHAEGHRTTASGPWSHAEGYKTTASGLGSHAEGDQTTASGTDSHAEGYKTTASGTDSHAQNIGTVAGYNAQTAIGQFNDNQFNNAFEIGNGTDDNNRSNAFEVDRYGNVSASGDIEDGQGNVLADKMDKVEEGTIDGWSYRKGSNGKVEAWYDYNPSASATYTTWVSPIKYRDITLPIPSGIFSDKPRVFAISRNNQIWVVSAVPSSATSVTIRLATLSSSAILSRFRIYATNY